MLLLPACGGEEPARSVLIASGRDDHGLVVQQKVSLSAEPEGPGVAEIPAGSLVSVLDTRGEWIRVRSVDGGADGWVNDYYLRGTAHLVADVRGCPVRARSGRTFEPNAQVELVGYERRGAVVWVRVRSLSGGREELVPPHALSEVPLRSRGAAPACDG
ncbi:MAG: SH3 domain-containing protein [Actinomycetota bacterium]